MTANAATIKIAMMMAIALISPRFLTTADGASVIVSDDCGAVVFAAFALLS
jgi:hypothetical protein